jgi:hypothetical protein
MCVLCCCCIIRSVFLIHHTFKMFFKIFLILALCSLLLTSSATSFPIHHHNKRRMLLHPHGVYAGVATFVGRGGISGYVRFDGTCVRGYTQISVNLIGLNRNIGRWSLNDGSAKFDCLSILGVSYGYVKGKPIVPYGSLSDRLGVFSNDDTIVQRVYLDSVVTLSKKYTAVGKVLVLYDAHTDLPRVCVDVVGEFHRRPKN